MPCIVAPVPFVSHSLWPTVCHLADAGPWPPRDSDAVDRLLTYAIRDGLLPLLMADDDVPPAVAAGKARFAMVASLLRRKADRISQTTQAIVAVLGPSDTLFQKGADYRARLYPDPALRPMTDIDLLVPKRAMDAALARFAAAGHRRNYCCRAGYLTGYHETSVLIDGQLVELHHGIGQRVRAGVDYAGLWARRETFTVDGLPACRFASADAILVDAAHLAKDEFSPPLVRFVDTALLLDQHEDLLPVCVDRARQWGVERALFGALHVTTAMFPERRTALTARAMEQLASPRVRHHLMARVLPDPATEPSRNSRGRRIQLWRKFNLMDRVWRRAAFVGVHSWQELAGRLFEWHIKRRESAT